jgi:flagellar P-ring protein precursor FlgI
VAKIVINERTGTVVLGGKATVTACAVAHGSLSVQVANTPVVSQPLPKSKGTTVVKSVTNIKVQEEKSMLMPVPPSTTIDKVVKSLNALGVTPRDLIAILQAMREAGALHAEIEVE